MSKKNSVRMVFGAMCLILGGIPGQILARDTLDITVAPVVVTATRIEIPLDKVGKAVTVITAEQLDAQKAVTLADALQHIPGVLVSRQRGPGGMVSVKIRGLDCEYTQILLNGLPLRDPSAPQGTAVEFMGDILVERIERIEIVRGSSSTLYGSDSVGGTINIITKQGASKPEGFIACEGGSYSTFREAAGISGLSGMFNYALTGKRVDSEGLDDHDEYAETAVSARVGLELPHAMTLSLHVNYSDSTLDLNDSPEISEGVFIPDQNDPDDTREKTLVNGGLVFSQDFSESLDYSIKLGYVDVERTFTFGGEGNEFGFGSESTYSGNILNGETQVNYSLTDCHLFTLGYEYEAEEFEQKLGDRKDIPEATRHAAYLQDSVFLLDDSLNIVPGIRYMKHDQAQDRVDWEISTSYVIGESGVRLHGHVGTGFRAPSLYELYGASMFGSDLYEFGNEELDPEESLGWDAGIEWNGFERTLQADLTYFRNEFDAIISFGAASYENVDGGESQGIELAAAWMPFACLNVKGAYTYTDTEDAQGEQFFNVAEHIMSLHVNYTFLKKAHVHLAVTVKGEEDIPLFDSMLFLSERYTNDGYTNVDVSLDYDVSKHINIWTRIENLFDESYYIGGYEAPGTSFYGGIKALL